LPGIAKSVLRIIKRKNYSISTIINPGTRLHIEAAAV